jgi:hypothetical protein
MGNNVRQNAVETASELERNRDLQERIEAERRRRVQNTSIRSGNNLREAKRELAAPNAGPAQTKKAQLALQDWNIINTIKQNVENGEELKKLEAQKVHDSEIRAALLSAAKGDELKTTLKSDEANLLSTLSALTKMGTALASRGKAMGVAGPAGTAAPKANASVPAQSNTSSVEKSEGAISQKALVDELSARLDAALAKAEADEKAAGRPPLTAEAKGKLREKLRNSLRGQLTAYYKAKAAEAALATASAYAQEGQLKREPASAPGEEPAERAHGMGDVIGSTFSAFQDQQAAGFSMRASDTEAAVNDFLSESGRSLAADPSTAGKRSCCPLRISRGWLFVRLRLRKINAQKLQKFDERLRCVRQVFLLVARIEETIEPKSAERQIPRGNAEKTKGEPDHRATELLSFNAALGVGEQQNLAERDRQGQTKVSGVDHAGLGAT